MKHLTAFTKTALYRKKHPRLAALHYLKQKSSFWVAALSLVAFVSGNMVGENGWYVFWKSVWGAAEDSMIAYEGIVTPIEKVPDYRKWSAYGGNAEEHTFRQVPSDILIPLPAYNAKSIESDPTSLSAMVYSVAYMGSYDTGHEGDGSHPGIDIRVPTGTPVRSVMNGIVTSVREDIGGFGKLVVVRHPNVPDPDRPNTTTVLYSVYTHLSAQSVTEGQIVAKGEQIALSGKTGFATGPHLHFQIDREAPWHPYWPFTSGEAREAGLTLNGAINSGLHQERGYQYTVNPMTYVQANLSAVTVAVASSSRETLSPAQLRDDRLQRRMARRQYVDRVIAASSSSHPIVVVQTERVATSLPDARVPHTESASASSVSSINPIAAEPARPASVAAIEFVHDGYFEGRQWETLRINLLDTDGNRILAPIAFDRSIHLMTAFGEAEFEKEDLAASDFVQGMAVVKVLPRGARTVVFKAAGFEELSEPMKAR